MCIASGLEPGRSCFQPVFSYLLEIALLGATTQQDHVSSLSPPDSLKWETSS